MYSSKLKKWTGYRKMSMTLPLLVLMYTLSKSRQNNDLKYQMPKHNMHVNLLFGTKAFLFVRKNNRCGQRTRKATSSSTNSSLTGMICRVSENHRRILFRTIETQKIPAPPFSGRFLGFRTFLFSATCRIFFLFSLFKILDSFCHEFKASYEGATF